jgi:hypothetical protein
MHRKGCTGSTSVRISSAPLNLYHFSSMLLQGVTGHDQSPVAQYSLTLPRSRAPWQLLFHHPSLLMSWSTHQTPRPMKMLFHPRLGRETSPAAYVDTSRKIDVEHYTYDQSADFPKSFLKFPWKHTLGAEAVGPPLSTTNFAARSVSRAHSFTNIFYRQKFSPDNLFAFLAVSCLCHTPTSWHILHERFAKATNASIAGPNLQIPSVWQVRPKLHCHFIPRAVIHRSRRQDRNLKINKPTDTFAFVQFDTNSSTTIEPIRTSTRYLSS